MGDSWLSSRGKRKKGKRSLELSVTGPMVPPECPYMACPGITRGQKIMGPSADECQDEIYFTGK